MLIVNYSITSIEEFEIAYFRDP